MSFVPERWRRGRVVDGADLGWMAVLAAIAIWVFHRLGGFDLWSDVSLPGGATDRIVRTFGAVDHPFHASRAALFRDALLHGGLLRWVSAHQGGYPVEFYPMGAPAFETAIWGVLLGTLPMMAAHKIAVIIIFLLPAAGFLLLAYADRLTLGVGVVALVFHISVRGWWWSGGYMELVDWGLVSSVLAMTAVLLFMPLAFLALRARSVRWGAGASIVAAFAVYTNVRSFLPLAAIGAGMLASLCWEPDRRRDLRAKAVLAGGVVALGALLAAPLLVPVLRFNQLYYFVSYQRYATLADYWHASITAVSAPIFVLATAGLAAVFLIPELVAGRFVAFTLIAHVAMTVLLSGVLIGPAIQQLEAPRLMPLQRALTIYLAAVGTCALLRAASRVVAEHQSTIVDLGLLGTAILTLLLYVVIDSTPIHASDRAMYPVLVTGEPFLLEQQRAVELADARAVPGTAILVLGSNLSWHDQFWSFQWSDRPFFFNDWLWYWQQDHFGVYDPETEHAYPDPASALDETYLRTHGIGAVVVTGTTRPAAATSPLLKLVQHGTDFDVYVVNAPEPMITAEGAQTTEIEIDNQRYRAVVSTPSTTFQIRRNWFPRWRATVDGQPARIARDVNGYMVVTAKTAGTEVEVMYAVDRLDWLGRLLLLTGSICAVTALWRPRRIESLLGLGERSG